MANTAADIMFDTLEDWGVEVIFGLPGDGINGIFEALRKRQDRIKFIQVRHEEAAAFAASAYSKFAGKLGVCLATSGPGGLHLTNGLYDAKMDGQCVLAITGHHYHDLIDTHSQQDVDLTRVFEDVSVYNARIMGPAHVENVTNLACRSALAYRGVAHINFPVDFQEMEGGQHSKRNIAGHLQPIFEHGQAIPSQEDLQRAADILNAGKKVAILAGRGALEATDELEQVAAILGAPIAKALLGKGAVPDDSPYTTGQHGLVGTLPSQTSMEECDTFFMVGTSFPYMEFLPKPGQAQAVQIDLDPTRVGLRYPVEVGLVGDSKKTLSALLPLLEQKEDQSFLEKAQAGMRDWWATVDERSSHMEMPMKPQLVAAEIGKRLDDNAICISDSGTITTWWARYIKAHRGQMFSVSGMLATMACGLPYAIGAQVAHPDRQVVALVGDGGFSMLMAEIATAVKYQLPIKIIIVKNNTLGQIRWEQMVFNGNPEFGVVLQPIDFVAHARACGATGFHIDDPRACGDILDQAFSTPGPVVVEAEVDPFEPPWPPKIKRNQAQEFATALVRGEPYRRKIALTAMRDKVRELL